MTVYVDELAHYGWKLRGHRTANCHMFTDAADLGELHAIARKIGMRREWFQNHHRAPHYDLTPQRRSAAIDAGAVPVGRRQAARIWQARRNLIAGKSRPSEAHPTAATGTP